LSSRSAARLFTFQRACILELFDKTGRFTPTWEGIGVSGAARTAYRFVSSHLKRLGLSDGWSPPVWTYEVPRQELNILATLLLSEHELAEYDYVTLELSVPQGMILRSSYGEWCSVYFNCLDTGAVEDDGRWLDWQAAAADDEDEVQAILPFLQRDWIVRSEPLVIEEEI